MARQTDVHCSVLIASHDTSVRNRWKRAISDQCIVHQASKTSEVQREVQKVKPSVLFIDLDLPGLNGIKGVLAIQRRCTATKILVFTSTPDPREELLVLEAGARGYCSADIDSMLIKRALHVILKGEIWADRGLVGRLLRELIFRSYDHEVVLRAQHLKSPHTDPETLTSREQEIVSLISRAASNKEIAGILQITESTVKAHLSSIFRKLGVADRLGLALRVKNKNQAAG